MTSNEMKFIDTIIDPMLVGHQEHRATGYTYLINWGLEISRIRCMWNTEDGNMDFRKNLPLEEKKKKEYRSCLEGVVKRLEDDPFFF